MFQAHRAVLLNIVTRSVGYHLFHFFLSVVIFAGDVAKVEVWLYGFFKTFKISIYHQTTLHIAFLHKRRSLKRSKTTHTMASKTQILPTN